MCIIFFFTLGHREISALLHFSSPLDKLHLHIEILVTNFEWSDVLYFSFYNLIKYTCSPHFFPHNVQRSKYILSNQSKLA